MGFRLKIVGPVETALPVALEQDSVVQDSVQDQFLSDFQDDLGQIACIFEKLDKALEQDEVILDRPGEGLMETVQEIPYEELESEFGSVVETVYPDFPETPEVKQVLEEFKVDQMSSSVNLLDRVARKNPKLRHPCKLVHKTFLKKLRFQHYMLSAANRKVEWLTEVRQKRFADKQMSVGVV